MIIASLLVNYAYAQVQGIAAISKVSPLQSPLKMTSTYGPENADLLELMRFENTDYYNIKFTGSQLKSKTYTIVAREIWNGKVKSEKLVVSSKELKPMGLDLVGDTVLNIKVMGKVTPKKKLKLSFIFPRFSNTKEFDALPSGEYSLRNLADESKLAINYNEEFHFMAYIMPYKRKDGSKSWCDVGGSGKDIENWGRKFGIKHYIIFEMKFE